MYIYKQNMLKSTIIVLSAIDGEETAGMIKHALLSPFPIQKQHWTRPQKLVSRFFISKGKMEF